MSSSSVNPDMAAQISPRPPPTPKPIWPTLILAQGTHWIRNEQEVKFRVVGRDGRCAGASGKSFPLLFGRTILSFQWMEQAEAKPRLATRAVLLFWGKPA